MGHVDHGKTSLLDSLRNTDVVSGEHGGITQHIGAYQVKTDKGETITFIDTPGHAAFTEMRARGSKVTDIVILVVAADDGVKPQTIEAIKHSKAAKVPIIVAINKCDLPNKNISKIKNDLMQHELIAEELSGETLFVEVSAKKKENLDKLKETILLQSEILDLKSSFVGPASGVVLESKIDKGKGPVSTILISSGLLKKGDFFVCGNTWGKIRAMINHDGKNVEEASPSMPIEILGMNGSAFAGAEFFVTENEEKAKEIVDFKKVDSNSNKNLIAKDKTKLFEAKSSKDELNIIIKSDVQGSNEALKMAINKIKHDEVQAHIILSDIGMINESDVLLAKASNALLIGFNVKPNREAKKLAEEQNIEIKYFNIIYEALESIEKGLSGLLEPDIKEVSNGSAQVQKVFKVSNAGRIAGSKVVNGEIKNRSKARLIRDGVVVYDGEISSIFREKNAVKEVKTGLECGIGLKDFIDFKENDIIESYESKNTKNNLMKKDSRNQAYSQRQLRVGELIKQNLGEIFIRNEAKIPMLDTKMITVTEVRMTPDLKTARTYVIPLGGVEMRKTVSTLTEFSHLVRKALSKKIDTKFLPKLSFIEDNSFEYAEKIERLIEKNKKNETSEKKYN